MASHGGSRPGAGRKPGKVSEVRKSLQEAKQAMSRAALEHAEKAIEVLAAVMANDDAPASARVSAACAVLDRGFGKPPQAVQLGSDAENPLPPSKVVYEVLYPPKDDGGA